jgi:hypothetical protein
MLKRFFPRGGAACSAAFILGILPAMTLAQTHVVKLYNEQEMRHFRVPQTWEKYKDKLTWGRGQTMAILDDGCDLTVPEWRATLPWGAPKVVAGHDSIDHDDDPTPVPPGYHGTTVGYPSSLFYEGTCGVAYNNQTAQIRGVSIVHLKRDESRTMAEGLQWVIDNHQKYNITAVNLSPLDDLAHQKPVPTAIDEKLATLRQLNIWVGAPCGNNGHTNGISWPACQPDCFAIGAAKPGEEEAINDRWANTDILVPASATSSSNAYAAGCSMILREAIEKSGYDWHKDGANLPEAMMAIFKRTGVEVNDPPSGRKFKRLDLLNAVDAVFANAGG